MLYKNRLIGVVVFLAFIFGWNPLFSQNVKTFRPLCCIAGKYETFHKDTPSLTCKNPRSGTGIMVIKQKKKCGGKIWGTITSEGIQDTITLTVPEDGEEGWYTCTLHLYNSTGRINEILHLEGNNINDTIPPVVISYYLYPYCVKND